MIVPKQTISGILDGSITTARVPLSTFALTVWTDDDTGEERSLPILPRDSTPLSAARPRTEDMSPNQPCRAGEVKCRLRIVGCEQISLEATSDEDAQADGYADAYEWALAFMQTYGKAVTGTDGYLLRFEVDRSAQRLTYHGMPWDPGTEDGQYRRAPEPEGVTRAQASEFARQARERDRKAEQARVAWYRERSLADQLRAIQEDEHLSKVGKDDLKFIAKRVQAIWDRGDKGDKAA